MAVRPLLEVAAMDDITRDVRSALYQAVGVLADEIELREVDRRLVVGGLVEDLAARDRVLHVVRAASALPIVDELRVRADWGEEAQAKQTEFGKKADARAITSAGFERID